MSPNRRDHPFSPDRPIESAPEDLLGRTSFSKALAKAVSDWRERESLVIALFGPWGSGKTSIKNLMLEELGTKGNDAPEILEFNPWQFSGQDELRKALFREIGLAIGRDNAEENRERLSKKLDAYAAYVQTGSMIIGGLPTAIVCSLSLAAVAGLLGSAIPRVRIYALGLCVLAIIAAALFQWGGTLLKSISNSVRATTEVSSKSLTEMKAELADILRKMKKPLLVIMDDIDRLTPEECLLVFQNVKANADFPNTVYLLLFERKAVEDRISQRTGLQGGDYIEKVVQVPFDIPAIDAPRLQNVLTSEIDKLIFDLRIQDQIDQRRWLNLYATGLSPYFQTLRDVRRFLSSLAFAVAVFKGDTAFEVNPIDLIALEVLRLFEPAVYRKLPQAKDTLTHILDTSVYGQSAEDRVRRDLKAITEGADEAGRERVDQILKQLFPPIEWALGGSRYDTDYLRGWLLERRVCHPDMFNRYFQLAIPEGEVSRADMERIVSASGNRALLVAELLDLKQRGLLGGVLKWLGEAYNDKVPLVNAVPFLTAILDIGEQIPKEAGGITSVSAAVVASVLPYWYLRSERDPAKRSAIVLRAASESTGLGMVANLIQSEREARTKQSDSALRLLLDQDLPKVRDIFLRKANRLASENEPKLSPRLAEILYCWRDLEPEKARGWAERLATTVEGSIAILIGFMQPFSAQTWGESVTVSRWTINIEQLSQFVTLATLEKTLEAVVMDKLGEQSKIAILAFREAAQSGKPAAWPLARLMGDGN